jgi:hypothetical protein
MVNELGRSYQWATLKTLAANEPMNGESLRGSVVGRTLQPQILDNPPELDDRV